MHFFDDSPLPENQEKLVIQVALYGPQWLPGDDDIPVTMEEQVQKAVDCYTPCHRAPSSLPRTRRDRIRQPVAVQRNDRAHPRCGASDMLIQSAGRSSAPEGEGQSRQMARL